MTYLLDSLRRFSQREGGFVTRTSGRVIDLLLETSAAETVTSRAIGMTITVEVVVVNRSKYMPHDLGFLIPPCNSQ